MIESTLTGQRRGLPEVPGYRYCTRFYPQAAAAIDQAEAEHGEPVPTCLGCGGLVEFSTEHPSGRCTECGQTPTVLLGPERFLAPCGTPAAYRRHKRRGEEPCAACRTACAKSAQERRQNRAGQR